MYCANCLNLMVYCQCRQITPLDVISGLYNHVIQQKLIEQQFVQYQYAKRMQEIQQMQANQVPRISNFLGTNQTIEDFFRSTWTKLASGTPTSIRFIRFHDFYLQRHKVRFNSLCIPNNEKVLFHGAPNTCSDISCGNCSACGIKESGFKLSYSGKNTSFLRFGKGIYFAPNSSKSNDYNRNDSSDYRCTIVSVVNLGNPVKLTHTNQKFSLPYGYHSVYGQAGGDLNYDEYVVYNENQVLPMGVIMYKIINPK